MELDLTRPNNGRMLDYWLGGNHNFEIDRQMARQIEKLFPFVVTTSRESRALVGRCVEFFHAQNLGTLVDFGSSLPTCQNTHEVAHALDPNIRVVYSDIDPITVAYAQDLLRGNVNVLYLHADATNPQDVLENPLTKQLIGDEHRVGIVFLNLPHVLSDEAVRASWRALYDWAAPGSYLALSFSGEAWDTEPDLIATARSYRSANLPFYPRTPAQVLELVGGWRVTQDGFKPNASWGQSNPPPQERMLGYSAMFYK